ncbi:flagellar biosynthesis protein FlhF [Gynuella sunshinyii]|uniref:Flagellar biosynthesis protein FlhF n=1 Tax=Gynuella sunshinyii YC6258 TaxID=1445510 RepID=A0A0C5VRC5_9GAMM|nr:flagellar biosynthesis protein FlhF [Gynuella sunshinyii]AJQ95968.1 flagellar GTP-binding protein [Gynuella sunshinyii YC6258]
MKTKRFHARSMSEGLKKISAEFGDEAIILSNRKVGSGVEILAAVEHPAADRMYQYSEPDGAEIIRATNTDREPVDKEHLMGLLSSIGPLKKNPAAQAVTQLSGYQKKHAEYNQPKAQIQSKPQVHKPAKPQSSPRAMTTNKSAAATRSGAGESREISGMRSEIQDLRRLLEQQSQELRKIIPLRHGANESVDPVAEKLSQFGLSIDLVKMLLAEVPVSLGNEDRWKQALAIVSSRIETCQTELVRKGGIYAFNGLTGSGKTTSLAKLAARFVMEQGADQLLLVSMDQFRIGAQDTLKTLSKILQCDFISPDDTLTLEDVLQRYSRSKRLILIDTCGSREGTEYFLDSLAAGTMSSKVRNILVIPSTTTMDVIQDYMDRFSRYPFYASVLTKVDESCRLGPALSLVMEKQLPMAYWTDGQNIPEDIHVARGHHIVSRAITSWRKRYEQKPDAYSRNAEQHLMVN